MSSSNIDVPKQALAKERPSLSVGLRNLTLMSGLTKHLRGTTSHGSDINSPNMQSINLTNTNTDIDKEEQLLLFNQKSLHKKPPLTVDSLADNCDRYKQPFWTDITTGIVFQGYPPKSHDSALIGARGGTVEERKIDEDTEASPEAIPLSATPPVAGEKENVNTAHRRHVSQKILKSDTELDAYLPMPAETLPDETEVPPGLERVVTPPIGGDLEVITGRDTLTMREKGPLPEIEADVEMQTTPAGDTIAEQIINDLGSERLIRQTSDDKLDAANKLFDMPQDSIKKASKKKKCKRVVWLDMKMKRLSDIDTTTETFRCNFHYFLTWLATQAEVKDYLAFEKQRKQKQKGGKSVASWKPKWVPQIEFTNAVSIHDFGVGKYKVKDGEARGFGDSFAIGRERLGFDPCLGRYIRCRYEANITFAEELELENHPFDCQDFSIYMKCAQDEIDLCDVVPFPRNGDYLMLDPQFSVLSEWELETTMVEFGHTDASKSKSLRMYALVAVHIKASRRWRAHSGHLLVTAVMFALGLGTFSMGTSSEELGERLGFAVTFLLADVATLQLMSQSLPAIPYFTLMDFYMYGAFLFLSSVTFWSCLTGRWHWAEMNDDNLFYVFLCIYLISQLLFLYLAFSRRHTEMRKLTMTDDELADFFRDRRSAADRSAITQHWNEMDLFENQKDSKSYVALGCKQKSCFDPKTGLI